MPVSYTRADGTLMVNDEPFFPIGMFHASWSGTLEQRSDALRGIAAAGFNSMKIQTFGDDDAQFLDEATALGIYVLIGGLGSHWQQYVNHPALLGWYIADDVEDHYTPEELQTKYDDFKALDSNHIIFISTYDPDRFGPYITIPDAALVYSYPIGQSRPISRVNQVLAEADTYDQAICGVPQAFAWETPTGRLPTPNESRNMTYQVLINGVKGLLHYSYGGGDAWNITENAPDLWAELIAMIPEFEALSSVYMDGTRTKISDTGTSDVFAAEWIYGNHPHIIIVNASYQAKNVSFPLPSTTTGQLQPMFAGRPDGLVNTDGVLSGSIGPLEVHVYEIIDITDKRGFWHIASWKSSAAPRHGGIGILIEGLDIKGEPIKAEIAIDDLATLNTETQIKAEIEKQIGQASHDVFVHVNHDGSIKLGIRGK